MRQHPWHLNNQTHQVHGLHKRVGKDQGQGPSTERGEEGHYLGQGQSPEGDHLKAENDQDQGPKRGRKDHDQDPERDGSLGRGKSNPDQGLDQDQSLEGDSGLERGELSLNQGLDQGQNLEGEEEIGRDGSALTCLESTCVLLKSDFTF